MIIQGTRLVGGSYQTLDIVRSGLTLWLDPQNPASYPGTGTTWSDLSGTNANITLVNNPAYTAAQPAHFEFRQIDQQYGTGSIPVLTPTTYTKSIWFNWNTYAANNMLSSYIGGHFMFSSDSPRLFCGHADWPDYNAFPSTTIFNTGQWYFVTLTFSVTDGMKLYVNGRLDAEQTTILTPVPGDCSTDVGDYQGSNLLDGLAGQVFCYNRVLTAEEQSQNFWATRWRYSV
jgi:hypothetical protein